jgi:Zn-dependent protease with chaperone function
MKKSGKHASRLFPIAWALFSSHPPTELRVLDQGWLIPKSAAARG